MLHTDHKFITFFRPAVFTQSLCSPLPGKKRERELWRLCLSLGEKKKGGREMIDGKETDDTDWQKKQKNNTTLTKSFDRFVPLRSRHHKSRGCRVSTEYHRFRIVAFGQSRISVASINHWDWSIFLFVFLYIYFSQCVSFVETARGRGDGSDR